VTATRSELLTEAWAVYRNAIREHCEAREALRRALDDWNLSGSLLFQLGVSAAELTREGHKVQAEVEEATG
jgi:hypothetical protein